MESLVTVKEMIMVKPSEPTPTCVLPLSALDSQLFLRFTIEYLFVYRPPYSPGPDRGYIAPQIKAALGRALVPYYPLAGRVRPSPHRPNLNVVCEAQGALFIEALSHNCTASDLENAPRQVTEWSNFLSLHVADVLAGDPPLVVQLTWLKDGAAALGVGISHCLCDGIGSARFLNSLAEQASGKRGLSYNEPAPVWERLLIDPKQSGQATNLVPHPEFDRVEDHCSGFMARFDPERLAPTATFFSERRLGWLKSHALATSQANELPFTCFEVLAAHVWRSWARALDLPPGQKLKLLFSVNVRTRMKPNLPGGFYGNGFVLGCAETSAKDMLERSLGHVAMLVRRAKERVDNEYVRSVVEAVGGSTRASADQVGVLILSQWSRIGLESVDFGMGRPIHVGPIFCDRYCLLLPVFNRPEAVKVMVAVPTAALTQYERLIRCPDC